DGELDALFTARAPSSFLNGEPHIARLFPDTRTAEKAYFKKTGLFPIMHLIGIRKALVEQYPWLPTSVYKAFCEAKALAMAGGGNHRDDGGDGAGLLEIRHRRQPARDRGADRIRLRAGIDRAKSH